MKTKKAGRKEEFIGSRRMSLALIFILEVMLVFSLLDYAAHSLSSTYSIPSYYFGSEIIYGTVAGFLVYVLIKKEKLLKKSLIFSAAMAIILQIAYIYLGYSWNFVLTFLVVNFALMFLVSYIGFRVTRR